MAGLAHTATSVYVIQDAITEAAKSRGSAFAMKDGVDYSAIRISTSVRITSPVLMEALVLTPARAPIHVLAQLALLE